MLEHRTILPRKHERWTKSGRDTMALNIHHPVGAVELLMHVSNRSYTCVQAADRPWSAVIAIKNSHLPRDITITTLR